MHELEGLISDIEHTSLEKGDAVALRTLRRVQSQLDDLRALTGWQDISSAPSDMPLLLGHQIDWPKPEWICEVGLAHCSAGKWYTKCTHWQPLPPPKEGQNDD